MNVCINCINIPFMFFRLFGKKMQKLGYLHHINSNENALKALKFLLCLPLLPAQNMNEGFRLIRAFALNHRVHLERLFSYYER